jgi:phosphoribosylglycinamide formyltransferase-1
MTIAVLSGPHSRGGNLAALLRAGLPVAALVTPSLDSPATRVARDLGVEVRLAEYGESHAQALEEALQGVDAIALSGYLRPFPAELLPQWPNRVFNIHPSLLPKFGGQGMYGRYVHRAVLQAGEKESGCTVHLVAERYDEGAILAQARCPVLADDTVETLAARVQALEHVLYPRVLLERLG